MNPGYDTNYMIVRTVPSVVAGFATWFVVKRDELRATWPRRCQVEFSVPGTVTDCGDWKSSRIAASWRPYFTTPNNPIFQAREWGCVCIRGPTSFRTDPSRTEQNHPLFIRLSLVREGDQLCFTPQSYNVSFTHFLIRV
jgi:hypothetical protein